MHAAPASLVQAKCSALLPDMLDLSGAAPAQSVVAAVFARLSSNNDTIEAWPAAAAASSGV